MIIHRRWEVERIERTLDILCMKVSVLKEEPPRLFMSLLVIRRTRGVVKPSPTAPINPNPISTQSTPSACMNIDLMLLKLFIVFFPVSLPSTSPIFLLFQRERERKRDQNDKRFYVRAVILKADTFTFLFCFFFLSLFLWLFFSKFHSHFIDPMR